jgi:hypothetical protein
MVQPINYMSQIPQPDLGQSLLSGLQLGTSIREIQEKRVASEQAEQTKAAYKTDLQEVLNNPSMKAFNDFSLKYPQQREVIKDVASRFTTEQQDAEFNIGRDVAVALENDKPEIALGLLTQTVDARKKSNLPPSVYGQVQQILSNVDDPDRVKKAKAQTNFALTLLNPEKFGKVVETLEKQKQAKPTLEKLEADAKAAGVTAEFARPLAQAQLDKANKEKLAPSVQEALDFANLTPEQQKTFSSLQVLKKPAGAVTNVNVTNLEKTAEGELGKLVPDLYNQANSAATQLTDLPRYRKALGIAITGPLANVRLDANRIGEALGFTGDKKINATRELIQGLSEMALKSRSMLTGQGAITDREQALLLQARSGDISFSKGELDIIFNVAERAANAQYTKSKKLLSSAASKSPTAQMFLDNVEALPSAPPAAGQRNVTVDY